MTWVAVAVGGASLVGTGLSIANQHGAFGGSSGGGGNSLQYANPAGGLLSSILGVNYNKQTNNGVASNSVTGFYPNSPFANLQSNLSQFINNPPQLQGLGDIQSILGGVPAQYNAMQGLFNNTIIPGATQLAQTGFPTSIAPVQQAALRQFYRQDVPALANQFAGQTGTFSTDFLNQLGQTAGDIETNLGALQTQLDEAAAGRRVQGLGLLPGLATASAGLGPAIGQDLFSTENQINQAQQALMPGYRGLQSFLQLSGAGTPGQTGPYMTGNFPSQTSNLLAGLGQLAPGFANYGLGGINLNSILSGASSQAGNAATQAGGFFNSFDPSIGAGTSAAAFNPNALFTGGTGLPLG